MVGRVATISKLVTVLPVKSPYNPEVGDVIIGRILNVDKKFWRVNIWAQRESLLNLTAINLPQGEQRIRGEEDVMQMRKFFKENDLLSGEIQQINQNGSIHIQTRNLKYGKLKNGILVQVNHELIKKKKHQFIELVNNMNAILGMNGIVWVYYSTVNVEDEYFTDDKTKIDTLEKEEHPSEEHAKLIILFKNIIESLDYNNIVVNKSTIMRFYTLLKGDDKIVNPKIPMDKVVSIGKVIEKEIEDKILKDEVKVDKAKKIIEKMNMGNKEDEEMTNINN